QTYLQKTCAEADLPCNEGGATRGAALLAVPVGEVRAFFRDAFDVGRLVAHHAVVVGADVPVTDVIAPEDEDVGFGTRGMPRRGEEDTKHKTGNCCCNPKHGSLPRLSPESYGPKEVVDIAPWGRGLLTQR